MLYSCGLWFRLRAEILRSDLYHRLSVFTIHVPPLRELRGDKLLLLNHFRDFYAKEINRKPFELHPQAKQLWEAYVFPGNTRELRNITIRLITKYPGLEVSPDQLKAELDLPQEAVPVTDPTPSSLARQTLQQTANFNLDAILQEQTSAYIFAAMELSQNNISEAAKLLGMNRTTLYSRIESLQKHQKPIS